MKIAIIDYGMGNLASVRKAINKIGCQSLITNRESEIREANALILPGVGAFNLAMKNLHDLNLVDVIKSEVLNNDKYILGICLGMQLFASFGTEGTLTSGLGLIEGKVVKIPSCNLRLPHIGWNEVQHSSDSSFANISDLNFYFVHSYEFIVVQSDYVKGITHYGKPVVAFVNHKNIFGTQFHPEKSQKSGLQFLKNFISEIK